MGWRLAKSLDVLRAEVDDLFPHRKKTADGTIGDASHQARQSDHNPNDHGVVCAWDVTVDEHAFHMETLANYLRNHRHPGLKYVIFNRRIASPRSSWDWRPYDGPSPHTEHMHVSVGPDGGTNGYDSTAPWHVATAFQPDKPKPRPDKPLDKPAHDSGDHAPGSRTIARGDSGRDVAFLQRFFGLDDSKAVFGPKTEAAVKRYQKMRHLTVDGVCGPLTWAQIGKGIKLG